MTNAYTQALPSSANIHRETLANGITVLVYEKPNVQSVVVAGSLPFGYLNDPDDKLGLSAFTAEMLTRGTTNRSFDTLHNALEMLGADLFVDAGRYKAAFGGKALAEDLPTLLTLLADVMQNPAFEDEHTERLRGQLATGINYAMQDTRYRARRAFYETLYAHPHPYAKTAGGTVETLNAITRDDLAAHHARYFGPKGMAVVIVGNVQAEAVVREMSERFAAWENPNQPSMFAVPDAPAVTGQRVFTPVAGKTQSDIMLGFVGPSRHSDDYQAAMLANSVLGQFGMMGRIGDVVREEKGYAYYSYSSIEGGHGRGAWSAAAGVAPQNVDETITDIVHEFERIANEPVSAEELDDVRSNYIGSLPLGLESNEGVANTILRMESYNLGLDYLLSYRDTMLALTVDDLQRAAQRYIDPAQVVVSVAGPDA